MKTLVVESNLMEQCLLAKVLTDLGHEVVSFESAEQAVLAYQKQFYPLLIADATLPGMSGLQFCRWVRSQPQGDRIFIILVTPPNNPSERGPVFEAGADDFLSKPLDPATLKARLTVAQNQMKAFFELKEAERLLGESQESFDRVVKTAREGVWWFDADFRTEFVNQRMAELLGCSVEELSGREARECIAESFRERAAGLLTDQKSAEVRCELALRRKDGSECPVQLSGAPLLTPKGELRGVLWMVTDLELQRRLEAQIAVLQDQAAEAGERLRRMENQAQESAAAALRLAEELAGVRRDAAERAATSAEQLTGLQAALRTEAELRQQAEAALAQAGAELQNETARRKQLEGAQRQALEQAQLEVLQHSEALSESTRSLQAAASERRRLTELLQGARRELEERTAQHARQLAEAERRLEAEAADRKREAEAARQARQDWEQQTTELGRSLRHTQEDLQLEAARNSKLAEAEKRLREEAEQSQQALADEVARLRDQLHRTEQELYQSRDALAARLKQHTAELLDTDARVQQVLAERRQVDLELSRLREETARRTAEQMNDLLQAADDLRAVLAERRASNAETLRPGTSPHCAPPAPAQILVPQPVPPPQVVDVPAPDLAGKPALAVAEN